MKPVEEGYKKQRQFISDARHELKTPISTIEANLTLLQRQIEKNKWLDNISFENKRMCAMEHDISEETFQALKNSF